MSLLPLLLDDFSSRRRRPTKIMDQRFGLFLEPEDLLQPLTVPKTLLKCPAGYIRNWKSAESEKDFGSTVSYDKDKFQANLDVQQFKPEEISVKVSEENVIIVEAKHDEKSDGHGTIFRHFIRQYTLPKDCDANKVESKISSDGVLTITAPRKTKKIKYKNIPIIQTDESASKKRKLENNA